MPALRPERPPLSPHGAERRQQLLEAARMLFLQKGYAATRIADICTAAGVAKGLVHWYFPDKASLFMEFVRDLRSEMARAQVAAVDSSADPLTQLLQEAEAAYCFWAGNEAFFTIVEREADNPAVAEEIKDWLHEYSTRFEALIVRGQRAGQIRAGDSRLLTVAAVGVVSSFNRPARSERYAFEAEEVVEFIGHWLTQALVTPGR